VELFGSRRVSWVDRAEIPLNDSWVDEWKVLMTAVQGTSAAIETKFLSRPILAGPGTACSETYLVAGRFEIEEEARRYAGYLRTRFVRFLVSLRKSTQHATKDVYSFVPDVPLDQDWTDALLYERYGLTGDEIAFIESQVAAHDDTLFDEDGADDSDE
jgi:site-specific DNA-methyltransferase (adenine-specific)